MRKADLVAKHSTAITSSSTPPTKSAPPKPKPTSAPPTSSKKASSSAVKAGTKRKKNSSQTDSDYEDEEFKVHATHRVNFILYHIAGKFGGGIKFGSLAVYITTAKLKSARISYLHIICMAIPYQTAKFKSANILAIVILGSTTKFNSCQYFGYMVINFLKIINHTSAF